MAGGPPNSPGGVFTAFPDKINRHWKFGLVAVCGVALLLFVAAPTPNAGRSGLRSDMATAPTNAHGHQVMTEDFHPDPSGHLNPPHGGRLVNLIAEPKRADEILHTVSPSLPSLTLTPRQLCDIELIINGGFSPLDGFMDQETYNNVVDNLRLGPKYNDAVFPMPITLDVSDAYATSLSTGTKLALRDPFFNLIGILTVTDKWTPDKMKEASKVFGTTDDTHPAVDYLLHQAGNVYVGGSIEAVRLPQHFDFNEIRLTPTEVRAKMQEIGWTNFVAFQTRNPMHRAHIELTRLAANENNLGVLIHPVVGMTKPGDVSYNVRVRCYKAIVGSGSYYKRGGVQLSLLPLAMRMAGPREALWHAIIRKNYGATHFIVGRDHAGCKSGVTGEDFYGSYDAQQLVNTYKDEVGITILGFKKLAYVPSVDQYMPADQVPKGEKTLSISGTKFRAMMAAGEDIPAWFSHPDVIKILREVSPPLDKRGFAVFFTGLSGSGKTTITTALIQTLQSLMPTRRMTVLDGDVVRTHLSSNLGFSTPDRNTNVARMGWVAAEVVRHGGVAICSTISPFHEAREESRKYAEATGGGFVLVHVSTPVEVCEARDVKGLYRKARDDPKMKLTGVSHPYEYPDRSELMIDASVVPVEKSVEHIVQYLAMRGYILEDTLPVKYTAVAPEVALKTAEVLTAGVADPSSKLCKVTTKHPGALVAFGDDGKPFADALKGAGVTVTGLDTSKMVGVERKVANDTKLPSSFVTPASTKLKEWHLVEAGWQLYYPTFKDHAAVMSNPRMLLYAPTLLRVDPCFKVLVVKPKDMAAAASSVDVSVDTLAQFFDAADRLKDQFPSRVYVVAAGSSPSHVSW